MSRPGYHVAASFPGGAEYERPIMAYLASLLDLWGIQTISRLEHGSMIVIRGYEWWTLCDNGGEINVEKINDLASLRSVPYTQHLALVPIGRVAWFCAQVILGEEITDYGKNPAVDDLTMDLVLATNAYKTELTHQ